MIENMLEKIDKDGVVLNVSYAFHSPSMNDNEDEDCSYF